MEQATPLETIKLLSGLLKVNALKGIPLNGLNSCLFKAISRLVACSKDEDTIGVVQSCHGVPTVVGELVNCLKALEHQVSDVN